MRPGRPRRNTALGIGAKGRLIASEGGILLVNGGVYEVEIVGPEGCRGRGDERP